MTCDDVQDNLLDFVEGIAPPDIAAAVREHLDSCVACEASFRQTRSLVGDISAARSVERRAWDSSAGDEQGTPDLAPATRIGDFEILDQLGRGGMGVVYRARQVSLNSIVALKILAAGIMQSERGVHRFLKEAQAAARLHHTNIVPVYAQGSEQGHYYYAMELIDGVSLDRVIRDDGTPSAKPRGATECDKTELLSAARPTERRLDEQSVSMTQSAVARSIAGRPGAGKYKRIARLIAEVADGLDHAHEQGVIHRDIKPQNLMLGADDKLHITDFGLARLLDEPGVTYSTEMVGTPAYMAPEQISRERGAIDRRTDVYALGVTLYELLTRRRPFEADSYDRLIHAILSRDPSPPRRVDAHVPLDLDTICLRAIEKDPRGRFASAAEMARDLRRYADDVPIASRRIGPLGKALRWVKRHPARTAAIAATLLLLAVGTGAYALLDASADAHIERAFSILLDDYRARDRAMAELDWRQRFGGDRIRRELVRAFGNVRTDPQRSVELLGPIVERNPQNADAHALLAWAQARLSRTSGAGALSEAQRQIELAEKLEGRLTAAGYFFRGQARWGLDPRRAAEDFDRAIRLRPNFAQAMLHQGRIYNQFIYVQRDIAYYSKARLRLENAADAQPDSAYPRYVLSLCHLMAAEIYAMDAARGEDRVAEMNAAYQASLDAALEAVRVEPSSPRGYAAQAQYYESRASYLPLAASDAARRADDLRAAIDAWDAQAGVGVRVVTSDRAERAAYAMRLFFWLGDYEQAAAMRDLRYGIEAGYTREPVDPDESFYAAMILASSGDLRRAAAVLRTGVKDVRDRPEELLLLNATLRLLGRASPIPSVESALDEASQLSPGWSVAFLRALVRGNFDEAPSGELPAAIAQFEDAPDNRYRLLAGAYFFRGMRRLADGRRAEALVEFRNAWQQNDAENYCFRAKLFYLKLRDDPTWPDWITNDAATNDSSRTGRERASANQTRRERARSASP